jgi:DNA-binding NarL/FixJ family response regulator
VISALDPLIGTGVSATLPMNTSLGWWPSAIHARIDTGDLSTARRQLGQLHAAADDRGLDLQARLAGLQARIHQVQGESDSADTAFAEAITAMGPDEALLDRALLHHEYGRFLRARRRRPEAVAQLALAHQLLSDVGAEPYRRRVAEDLESCGLHPNAPSKRSPLGLTDREQDVASLVAKGLTNREVAAQLYVSSKAVEYHLRNIFGKLGISSRNDLPAALSARSSN